MEKGEKVRSASFRLWMYHRTNYFEKKLFRWITVVEPKGSSWLRIQYSTYPRVFKLSPNKTKIPIDARKSRNPFQPLNNSVIRGLHWNRVILRHGVPGNGTLTFEVDLANNQDQRDQPQEPYQLASFMGQKYQENAPKATAALIVWQPTLDLTKNKASHGKLPISAATAMNLPD